MELAHPSSAAARDRGSGQSRSSEREMRPRPGPALAVATAGYGLVLLDVTIVNVALEAIARSLGASRAELQWVVDGYALALAGLMLSAGHLADRLGRRRVFAGGLVAFGVASAACALAPSAGALIAARVLQGLGAAALLPASLALVTSAHPDGPGRARAIGIWAGLGSLGLVAGPLLGGLLTSWLGWRAVFWLSVPVCAAALAGLRVVAESRATAHGARPDVAGQLAAVVALTALVGGLIEARREGWGTAPVLSMLALAVVAFAALIRAERRAERPMLDLAFFRDPSFSAANAGAGLMNLGVLGALFSLSLLLQGEQGLSPAAAGVRLLPLAAPLALLPPLASRWIGRHGARLPAALGLAGTGAGFLALALLGPGASYAAMLGPLLLAGVALGFATPGVVTGATASVPGDRAGMAAAINNTARQTGGAVGVALIGGVAGAGGFALSAAALGAGALACGALLRS
jgi:MFS transporter, DHA2 family, methylenomycin A resistance protein